MKFILENPFRILGLPVNATDRQISKRVSDLTTYIEMGMSKKYPTDFSFLPEIERTRDTISRAAGQLELAEQKVFHSIFWFYIGNSSDELIFELFKDKNYNKAKELLEKPVLNSNLSSSNISTYRNHAIFKLLQLDDSADNYHYELFSSITIYMDILKHGSFDDFISLIGGLSCKANKEDIQKHLVNEVHKIVFSTPSSSNNSYIVKKYISTFQNANDDIAHHVKSQFTDAPTHRLDLAIKECENIRSSHAYDSEVEEAADKLYGIAFKTLKHLESIIGKSDLSYQFIADKTAKELLLCSTAYFNTAIKTDNSETPLINSETITKRAKLFAVSSKLKSDINEDLEQIEELKKQKKFEEITKKLLSALKKLPNLDDISQSEIQQIPSALRSFLDVSIPQLNLIRNADYKTYCESSDTVVCVTLMYCIEYANKTSKYREIVNLMGRASTLHMEANVKQKFNQNYQILKQNNSGRQSADSGGCYIATLVYGSYHSPEVLVLRKFRDNVLAKTLPGRLFIKFYYATSPNLVNLLKNQNKIQDGIRCILNKLVRSISK